MESYNISLKYKDVLIINRSIIVGKPLIGMLLSRDATVTIAHSKTSNLKEKIKCADIIITAAGKSGLITNDMVKIGSVIIDVSINKDSDGKICGDCLDFVNFTNASYITPVPGGVGPMTIAMLYKNLLKAYKIQNT
jgi:methylenetetrahydrofolate dehydrogenase (NADP+)/methenyltetrahydrofolate cyclohydrolase